MDDTHAVASVLLAVYPRVYHSCATGTYMDPGRTTRWGRPHRNTDLPGPLRPARAPNPPGSPRAVRRHVPDRLGSTREVDPDGSRDVPLLGRLPGGVRAASDGAGVLRQRPVSIRRQLPLRHTHSSLVRRAAVRQRRTPFSS